MSSFSIPLHTTQACSVEMLFLALCGAGLSFVIPYEVVYRWNVVQAAQYLSGAPRRSVPALPKAILVALVFSLMALRNCPKVLHHVYLMAALSVCAISTI